MLGTVLRDGGVIPRKVYFGRRIACIEGSGNGFEAGSEWAEHVFWDESENYFHVG